jgi:hypothetical protein
MRIEQKILKVFETLYETQYKRSYKTNKNDDICKFLKLARSKGIAVGESFVVQYMLFQYNQYYKLENTKLSIRLSWLLSGKSLEKYFNRDFEYDFAIGYTMLKDMGINKSKIMRAISKKSLLKKEDFLKINPIEENAKKNNPFKEKSIRKLWFCKTRTSMFHPLSEICLGCDMKEMCKEEQNKLTRKYREDGNTTK